MYKRIRIGLDRIKGASKDNSILIYQMGKVGSSSLESSIPDSAHMHTLYSNPPCPVLLNLERPGFLMKGVGSIYDFVRRATVVRRKDVKIITVIRSPMERNVSMFFQDFPFWYIHYRRINRKISRFSDEQLFSEIFENVFPHDYVNTWFDKEIHRLTGIDVYSEPFDKEKGFQTYSNGKYQLLLVEVKKLDSVWNEVEAFVGAPIEKNTTNVSENKWYAPLYKAQKSELLQNTKALEIVRNGKFFKHFYE